MAGNGQNRPEKKGADVRERERGERKARVNTSFGVLTGSTQPYSFKTKLGGPDLI